MTNGGLHKGGLRADAMIISSCEISLIEWALTGAFDGLVSS